MLIMVVWAIVFVVDCAGFFINGVKFMKLHSELGAVIRGKQGENAAAAAFSKKAIIIATGKGE